MNKDCGESIGALTELDNCHGVFPGCFPLLPVVFVCSCIDEDDEDEDGEFNLLPLLLLFTFVTLLVSLEVFDCQLLGNVPM